MAATFQAPPTIGVTAPDEDMDFLSDNGRMDQDDDLIEIDTSHHQAATDDFDFTLDDADPGHDDDEMIDDYAHYEEIAHEDTMQDDIQPQDELLDDASLQDQTELYDEATLNFTNIDDHASITDLPAFDGGVENLAHEEPLVYDNEKDNFDAVPATDKIGYTDDGIEDGVATPVVSLQQAAPAAADLSTFTEESLTHEQPQVNDTSNIDQLLTQQTDLDKCLDSEAALESAETGTTGLLATVDENQDSHDTTNANDLYAPGEAEDKPASTEAPLLTQVTEVFTQDETYAADDSFDEAAEVPTIMVDFYGDEYSLFPPAQSFSGLAEYADYSFLLADATAFHKSLTDVLVECRHVLSDHIQEDQELELNVPALGLKVNESSTDCSNCTMEQIATVFHTLNANDGQEEMQPLWVTLTTQTKFSLRFAALQQAVNEQKGMSELAHLLFVEEGQDDSDHDQQEQQQNNDAFDIAAVADDDSSDETNSQEVPEEDDEVEVLGENDQGEGIEGPDPGNEIQHLTQSHEYVEAERTDAPVPAIEEQSTENLAHVSSKQPSAVLEVAAKIVPSPTGFAKPLSPPVSRTLSRTSTLQGDEVNTAEANAAQEDRLTANDIEPFQQQPVAEPEALDNPEPVIESNIGLAQEPIYATDDAIDLVQPQITEQGFADALGNNTASATPYKDVQHQSDLIENTSVVVQEHEDSELRPQTGTSGDVETNFLVNSDVNPFTNLEEPEPITKDPVATLDEDENFDFDEEANSPEPTEQEETAATPPMNGTKRSWDDHLDNDLLDDEDFESPKRSKHTEAAE